MFITLKLLGKITWSWWWVLSPIWLGVVIWILFVVVVFTIFWIKQLRKK